MLSERTYRVSPRGGEKHSRIGGRVRRKDEFFLPCFSFRPLPAYAARRRSFWLFPPVLHALDVSSTFFSSFFATFLGCCIALLLVRHGFHCGRLRRAPTTYFFSLLVSFARRFLYMVSLLCRLPSDSFCPCFHSVCGPLLAGLFSQIRRVCRRLFGCVLLSEPYGRATT